MMTAKICPTTLASLLESLKIEAPPPTENNQLSEFNDAVNQIATRLLNSHSNAHSPDELDSLPRCVVNAYQQAHDIQTDLRMRKVSSQFTKAVTEAAKNACELRDISNKKNFEEWWGANSKRIFLDAIATLNLGPIVIALKIHHHRRNLWLRKKITAAANSDLLRIRSCLEVIKLLHIEKKEQDKWLELIRRDIKKIKSLSERVEFERMSLLTKDALFVSGKVGIAIRESLETPANPRALMRIPVWHSEDERLASFVEKTLEGKPASLEKKLPWIDLEHWFTGALRVAEAHELRDDLLRKLKTITSKDPNKVLEEDGRKRGSLQYLLRHSINESSNEKRVSSPPKDRPLILKDPAIQKLESAWEMFSPSSKFLQPETKKKAERTLELIEQVKEQWARTSTNSPPVLNKQWVVSPYLRELSRYIIVSARNQNARELAGKALEHSNLEYLERIRELDLSGTKVTTLPDLRPLKKVRTLDLSGNQLKCESIPPSLQELNKLDVLILSQNNLTKVPEFLLNMKQLNQLDIRENPISEVPSSLKGIVVSLPTIAEWVYPKPSQEIELFTCHQ